MEEQQAAHTRVYYYDVLKVLSCVSVVALHCNAVSLHRFDTGSGTWPLHVLFETLFHSGVPVFFMLSGATLLNYRERYGTRTFFRRRLRKAFVPFAAFAALFYAVSYILLPGYDYSPRTVAENILTGNIPLTDFWFFVPLFLIYLFMPFLAATVRALTERQLMALVILTGALHAAQTAAAALVGVTWDIPLGGYVVYPLMGYYLSRTAWERRGGALATVIALAVIATALRYAAIYVSDHAVDCLFSYTSPDSFLAAAALFLLVKRLCGGAREGRVVAFLAGKTFGVYLIQRFVITCFAALVVPAGSDALTVLFPVVYAVCVAAVTVMQRCPATRWMVPA